MSSPPTFQTDRLLLRPWIEDDLESFHSAVYSDPVSFYGYHENIEESFQTLDSAIWMNRERTSEGFGSWAVVRRLDNELVGIVNLDGINRMYYAIPQEDAGSTYISLDVEVGYAFGKQFRGQGYATEACQAVIDYAFGILRIRRLVTPANSENKGVCRTPKATRLSVR